MKIHTNKTQRVLHSTDISLYEILPSGVVFPKNANEVGEILNTTIKTNLSSKEKVTIHSRGAGTGTAGQSLGKGIIINFTRHMDHIIEIGDHYVDVEPGVLLGKLNIHLSKHGVFMPVDPSSMEVCSVGGMVANNSAGEKTLSFGQTERYVKKLKVIFSDGNEYEY
ncbi:MAG: FAD-binding oxidoreductase, partial [bacterium]